MEFRVENLREQVRAGARGEGVDVAAALRAIAKPRMAGTEGAEEVETEIRGRFEALGYGVREHPFNYSHTAARFALTKLASVFGFGALVAMVMLLQQQPVIALVVLLVIAALVLGGTLYAKRGIDRLPWGRGEARNLWFQREDARPRWVFMAHRDSKSQLVPLSLRGPAIIVGLIGFGALLVLSILSIARYVGDAPVVIAGVGAILAAILLALSWVDNKSPGALDNASGVVTLLALAARERGNGDVAFLLTDAEELGLVGARAIARRFPAVHGVINVDGIDDVGPFHVIERFGWPRPKGLAPHLAAALLGAASALELPAQRRDAPFGILLDHMPIVRGGTPALSVMRGRLGSLMRVHRPGDDVSKLRGTGVEEAVDLFAGALHLLRDSERKRTG